MGLPAILQSAGRTAFRAAGDVPLTGTFRSGPINSGGASNVTTWAVTRAVPLVQMTHQRDVSEEAYNTNHATRQIQFIALAEHIGMAAEDIRETSQMDVKGETWTIINAKPDPAGVSIILTLQR